MAMADTSNSLWRDRNKVFVAGIPAHADDDALYQKFAVFGEMFQSKVVRDARTGASKGFGFLTFANYEHALEAVGQMNQAKWENRVLNVRFLQPKPETGNGNGAGASASVSAVEAASRKRPAKVLGPCPPGCVTVYVGNLAYGITDPVLRKVFAGCGDVKAVRFANHIETKEFRGFGHVQFYDSASCEKAVLLDGMVVMGRPMSLDYGSRDEATEKAREELQRKLKKGVCHKFQSGQCPRGDDCKFAHVLSGQDVATALAHVVPRGATTTAPASAPASAVVVADETPVCQSFLSGKCKRGDKCKFRHVQAAASETPASTSYEDVQTPETEAEEDADATPVCQGFLKGKCKRGDKCKFRHVDAPVEAVRATPTPTPVIRRVPPPAVVNVVSEVPVCLNFRKGTCNRGDGCRFRHAEATPVAAPIASPTVEPADAPHQSRRSETTEADDDAPICQSYLKSKCKRGAKCRFRHVDAAEAAAAAAVPVAVPTISICQNFQRGRCMRGSSCRFAHTMDMDDAANANAEAARAAAVVAAAAVTTAHSDYQKRFQSVCYNWQNARTCARGDACPFYHDGATKATTPQRREQEEEVEEQEEETKVKKSKKRKTSGSDSGSEEDDDKQKKKSKKSKKEKKAKREK